MASLALLTLLTQWGPQSGREARRAGLHRG
jgi:hypothetical protein